MEKNVITAQDFKKAKDRIQKFSSTAPRNLTLPEFENKGWFFGLGNHNVTGNEMNNFVSKTQDIFVNYNKTIHSIISEFHGVYKAFESLDRDYIQSILLSIKASESASNWAKEASKEAMNAQKDISRTIDGLEQTINVLKEFKEYVTKDLHGIQNNILEMKSNMLDDEAYVIAKKITSDTGVVWNNIQNHSANLMTLQEQLLSVNNKLDLVTTRLSDSVNLIEEKRTIDQLRLTRKLKFIYAMAGGALIFTTIQTILNLLGVI